LKKLSSSPSSPISKRRSGVNTRKREPYEAERPPARLPACPPVRRRRRRRLSTANGPSCLERTGERARVVSNTLPASQRKEALMAADDSFVEVKSARQVCETCGASVLSGRRCRCAYRRELSTDGATGGKPDRRRHGLLGDLRPAYSRQAAPSICNDPRGKPRFSRHGTAF
jgi:hypothetical protein